jgi:hypothetical protein
MAEGAAKPTRQAEEDCYVRSGSNPAGWLAKGQCQLSPDHLRKAACLFSANIDPAGLHQFT